MDAEVSEGGARRARPTSEVRALRARGYARRASAGSRAGRAGALSRMVGPSTQRAAMVVSEAGWGAPRSLRWSLATRISAARRPMCAGCWSRPAQGVVELRMLRETKPWVLGTEAPAAFIHSMAWEL